MHHPGALASRLSLLLHVVDQNELALLVAPPDAVDDELVRVVEGDPDDILAVRLAREEAHHVELSVRTSGSRTSKSENDHQRSGPHCRPASSASTIVGSASVEMSPKPSVAPSAIFLKIRRMIFPDRVFGSAGVKWIFSGAENAPMSCRTSLINSRR